MTLLLLTLNGMESEKSMTYGGMWIPSPSLFPSFEGQLKFYSAVDGHLTCIMRVFPRPFRNGGGNLSPHMGGQVQGDKVLTGGLLRGDINLMGGKPNLDRLYHKLKVLLPLLLLLLLLCCCCH